MNSTLPQDVQKAERLNTGTAITKNFELEKNGYLAIKNFQDVSSFVELPPQERGQINFFGKNKKQAKHFLIESQVPGSLSRYWYPLYTDLFYEIKKKVEENIGKKVYPTYYYDRYYFSGQELVPHVDRDACEISVTLHISTSLDGEEGEWPIFIKTPDEYSDKQKTKITKVGETHGIILKPGDAVIYKGCERPHWRNKLLRPEKRHWFFQKESFKEFYYHQIFFHFVLQDGLRCHHAFDPLK